MRSLKEILLTLLFTFLTYSHTCLAQDSLSVYHSQRGYLSISVPTSWTMDEFDGGKGVWVVTAFSPKESISDIFSENVNIAIFSADTKDLSEANKRTIDLYKQNFSQFTLLETKVDTIGPHPAAWFVHTFSYQGQTGKSIKYTLIKGNLMYVVTCTALPETFIKFRSIFDKIVSNIVLD
jgi:hypothetical protein